MLRFWHCCYALNVTLGSLVALLLRFKCYVGFADGTAIGKRRAAGDEIVFLDMGRTEAPNNGPNPSTA